MPFKFSGHLTVMVNELPMMPMMSIGLPDALRSLARDRSGATTIENSLLAALVAVAVISAASEIGSHVFSNFDNVAQSVGQASNSAAGNCGPGNGNGNCGNSGSGGGNTEGSGPGTGNGGSTGQ